MQINEGQEDPQKAIQEGIDPTNYAMDEEKVSRFKKEVVSLIPMIEAQRVTLEERWNRYHHVWARKNTADSRFYTGVNDAYFPVAMSNIETLVAYLAQQIFPAGLKFAIQAPNPMVPPAVIQKITALYEYFIHLSQMQANFKLFCRQGVIFGPTVVKNVWRDETIKVYKPKNVPVVDPTTGQQQIGPDGQPVTQFQIMPDEIVKYRGPTFYNVDILSLYLHPYQARDIDECTLIFEKIDRDFRDIKSQEGKAYLGTDRIQNSQEMSQNSRDAVRRNANRDFRAEPYGLSTYQIRNPNQFTLNEMWCLFDLYGDGVLMPCKAVVANDIVLELRQNPYWNQRPPYRLWRAIQHDDHIYGMGWMELVEHHQYTLNAIINQALDANLYQSNQMMCVDADRYQGRLADIQYAPLSVMAFSGPGPVEDAILFHKPENTAADMFAVANIVAGSLQDTMGTPPVVQGKMSNKERTATEVSAVAQGASVRIDSMADDLRLQIIQGWMEDTFALMQQYCDDGLDFAVTGMPPIHMERNDVLQMPLFFPLTGAEADAMQAAQAAQQQESMMANAQLQRGPGPQGAPGKPNMGGPEGTIGDKSFGPDSGP